MTHPIVAHILCGGSGTRLWPMSREEFPKQFAPLLDGKSLLTATIERAALFGDRIVCISNAEHRFLVDTAAQLAKGAFKRPIEQILEPLPRNTAAAIACAALLAHQDELLLFLSADHHVPDAALFAQTVQQGVAAALDGHIVTFGITPTFASTGYGYIEQGAPLADANGFAVQRFIEKPTLSKAEAYLADGKHLWNAGIFLAKARDLINAFELHAPDILRSCEKATQLAGTHFGHLLLDTQSVSTCRSESIDFAIMEKHAKIAVIPFAGFWSDVGSWNAVAQLQVADTQGNRLQGRVQAIDCKNTVIHSSSASARQTRPVVALGLDDIVVVDTDDALLVSKASHVEQVKLAVQALKQEGANQVKQHSRVLRHWGSYDNVDEDTHHRVRRIHLSPGHALNLQVHQHRTEHWIVIKGIATVRRDQEVFTLGPNQSTVIPLGATHQLSNQSDAPLEMIEVQTGSQLTEEDVLRPGTAV